MSYIRLTEERRYFPGESNLYVYPTASREENVVRFDGDLIGTIKAEDFWELIIRALEKTDLHDEAFWAAQLAIKKYYEEEKQSIEDLEELAENE